MILKSYPGIIVEIDHIDSTIGLRRISNIFSSSTIPWPDGRIHMNYIPKEFHIIGLRCIIVGKGKCASDYLIIPLF